jgi:hypothetical protein
MKSLIAVFTLFLFHNSLQAQCVPDSVFANSSVPGFFPSPLQGALPEAVNGSQYELKITLKVPQDTTIDLKEFGLSGTQTIGVNSMKVNSVNGLPEGIEFGDCSNASCKWSTNEVGCIKIFGTPTEIGDFDLGVNITMNVQVPILGGTDLPAFDLITYEMEVTVASNIDEDAATYESGINIYPNPTKNVINLECNVKSAGTYTLEIINSLGQRVNLKTQELESGNTKLTLPVETFETGVYFLRLNGFGESYESKVLIK